MDVVAEQKLPLAISDLIRSKSKAAPLHPVKAPGVRGSIAPTHS
jgi:hypothetical protein